MAEIFNLNKARKKKAREDAQQQAAENRVKFGRTKAQKALDTAQEKAARERMDQLRRDRPGEPEKP